MCSFYCHVLIAVQVRLFKLLSGGDPAGGVYPGGAGLGKFLTSSGYGVFYGTAFCWRKWSGVPLYQYPMGIYLLPSLFGILVLCGHAIVRLFTSLVVKRMQFLLIEKPNNFNLIKSIKY